MGWIKDLIDPNSRKWEEFYRNRWQYDKTVRCTHGVNCTGGCSWQVYVKDGLITWEMQAGDYPLLESNLPPYEPRGCQRGISASWYVYSPIRVKYPYVRGALMDLWREAKEQHEDPVAAWNSIVSDKDKRALYQQARGKGGFRRAHWDEVLEITAASCLHTAKKWGPDRVIGFSPIPAMSYLSYAGGSRFLQLFGGVNLSFYDWYSDLPNAFPEVWGEQTDVCESADWYNSKYIIAMGSNLSMTRTPDVHFISEARTAGTKFVVIAPDFNQAAKFSDWWVPVKAGEDAAMWMAVNHVILTEFHVKKQVPYFMDYLKRYSDSPFLVKLVKDGEDYKPDQFLRAESDTRYRNVEHSDWQLLVYDSKVKETRLPKGSIGARWTQEKGKWNLKMEDFVDDKPIDPTLTFLKNHDEILQVKFRSFADESDFMRGVPIKFIDTTSGKVPVTTVYDLLMAHFGVDRGLAGAYPTSYDDESIPYTPAWQEKLTGLGRDTVVRLAREFAYNAEITEGRSMVIIGAGINHWYHNNLHYRSAITALMLTGCCGVNGGGMNHYVGQEKVTLIAPWASVAFGLDWAKPPRLQQTPIWHYINSDQWRYEGEFSDYADTPPGAQYAKGHAVDHAVRAVRMGWMPFYPQFNANPLKIAEKAKAEGAQSPEEIARWVTQQLKERNLKFSAEDPDAPTNWPRVWFIWRGNAIMSSAKGHEFFLRHYLGTHDNSILKETGKDTVQDVTWRDPVPRGKMDLVIDLNFRMDTSALYSDIVLPAAMWYEKNDLNTTDLHSFVHPLAAAVPPSWESRSDWDIFRSIAKAVSDMSGKEFPKPVKDVVTLPLQHDTPDEISQPEIRDWLKGECEPIPGKTMPHIKVVERDYANLYNRFISLGPLARNGISTHGIHIPIESMYDELAEKPVARMPSPQTTRCTEWDGKKYPSLEDAIDAANIILALAPETNGEIAHAAFKSQEERVGLPLTDLADDNRGVRMTFADIVRQPRRTLTSPCWSGIVNNGRAYSGYTMNVERKVPWRTLTGRQHFYLDHRYYLDFGEHLPTYKSKLDVLGARDIADSLQDKQTLKLNYLTPHGKWQIHSTYSDNLRMLTLSRGIEPCWLNVKDAEKIGVQDNDWVEVYNDNGVMVTRAVVSSRVQQGTCMVYHSPERTYSVPKSQLRNGRRAGGHNSLTRCRINPLLLAGGYAQFSYGFNYWGPTGVNRDTHVLVRPLKKLEW